MTSAVIAAASAGLHGLKTMVVGVDAAQSGFNDVAAVFGSMEPQNVFSELLKLFTIETSAPRLVVSIEGTLLQTFWTTCEIIGPGQVHDGVILVAAAADAFTQAGGRTSWQYDDAFYSTGFTLNDVYELRFR